MLGDSFGIRVFNSYVAPNGNISEILMLFRCIDLRQAPRNLKSLHVGIVGAGIGGLAAAIALRRAGAEVTVLEAAAQLGEVR